MTAPRRRRPVTAPPDRHPCPELREAFGPRGWTFFRTGRGHEEILVHAVFARTLPHSEALGFREHIAAPLPHLPAELDLQAVVIEGHAKVCRKCAQVFEVACRSALGTLIP
ncbi:hypothetical protein J0910_01985 [Nocardiopsis sp. CNT-189]|uniref:hypothetical protein n=1 Tax=Nocardiopsis oceanisediminis TaxID=2816862 RepID=UPI003B3682D1